MRGLAFFGEALAHGVLPGIALAAIWGFDLSLGAMVSAVVMVGGVNLVHRTTRLSDDTGIGLLFVGMLALGVIIISREDTYAGDLTAFLFGDILGVDAADLRLGGDRPRRHDGGDGSSATAPSSLSPSTPTRRPRSGCTQPSPTPRCWRCWRCRSSPASSAVGTLLVFGLLVAPPATALLFVRRLPLAMLTAVGFGCLAVVAGLVVSYHADTAASATVAGIAVGQFFVVLAASSVLRRRTAEAA